MNKSAWKRLLFITLTIFLLLTISLTVWAFQKASQTTIIGIAGWPTFSLHLALLLRSPIGYVHAATFVLSLVSCIGWCVTKK